MIFSPLTLSKEIRIILAASIAKTLSDKFLKAVPLSEEIHGILAACSAKSLSDKFLQATPLLKETRCILAAIIVVSCTQSKAHLVRMQSAAIKLQS